MKIIYKDSIPFLYVFPQLLKVIKLFMRFPDFPEEIQTSKFII